MNQVATAIAKSIFTWWHQIRAAAGDCRVIFPAPTRELAGSLHTCLLAEGVTSYLVALPGSAEASEATRTLFPEAVTSVRDGSFVCVLEPGVLSRLQDSISGSGGGIRALSVPDEWPWKDGEGVFSFDPGFVESWMAEASIDSSARGALKVLLRLMKDGLEPHPFRTAVLFDEILQFSATSGDLPKTHIERFLRHAGLPMPSSGVDILSASRSSLAATYSVVRSIYERMRAPGARATARANIERAWQVSKASGSGLLQAQFELLVENMLDRLNTCSTSNVGILSLRHILPEGEAEWSAVSIEVLQVLFEAAAPDRLEVAAEWIVEKGSGSLVVDDGDYCLTSSASNLGVLIKLGAAVDRALNVSIRSAQQVLGAARISPGEISCRIQLAHCSKASAKIRISLNSDEPGLTATATLYLEQCDRGAPFVVVPRYERGDTKLVALQRFDLEEDNGEEGEADDDFLLEVDRNIQLIVVYQEDEDIYASIDDHAVEMESLDRGIERLVISPEDPALRSPQPELILSSGARQVSLLLSPGRSQGGEFILEDLLSRAVQAGNARRVAAARDAALGLGDVIGLLGTASGPSRLRLDLARTCFENEACGSAPIVAANSVGRKLFQLRDGLRCPLSDVDLLPPAVAATPVLSAELGSARKQYEIERQKVIDALRKRVGTVPASHPLYAVSLPFAEPSTELEDAICRYAAAYSAIQQLLPEQGDRISYAGRFQSAFVDCFIGFGSGQVQFVSLGPWHPIVVAKRALACAALLSMGDRITSGKRSWLDRLAVLINDVAGAKWFAGIGVNSSAVAPYSVSATNDPGWLICEAPSSADSERNPFQEELGIISGHLASSDAGSFKGYLNDFRRAFPSKRGIVVDCGRSGRAEQYTAAARELLTDSAGDPTPVGRLLPGGVHLLSPSYELDAGTMPDWADPPVCVYLGQTHQFRGHYKIDILLAEGAATVEMHPATPTDREIHCPCGEGDSANLELPIRILDQGAGALRVTRVIHNSTSGSSSGIGGALAKARATMQSLCGGGMVSTVATHQVDPNSGDHATWTVLPGDNADPAVLLDWALHSADSKAPVVLWDFRFALTRASNSYYVMSEIPQGLLKNVQANPVFQQVSAAGPALLELAALGVALGSEAFKSHSRALGVVGLIGAARFFRGIIDRVTRSEDDAFETLSFMLPVDSFQDILGAESDVSGEGLDADSRRADLLVVVCRTGSAGVEFSFAAIESKYASQSFSDQRAAKALGQAKRTLDRILLLAEAARKPKAVAERLALGRILDFGLRLANGSGSRAASRAVSAALSGRYAYGLLGRSGAVLVSTETTRADASIVSRSDGIWIRLAPNAWPGERRSDRVDELVSEAMALLLPAWRQRKEAIASTTSAAPGIEDIGHQEHAVEMPVSPESIVAEQGSGFEADEGPGQPPDRPTILLGVDEQSSPMEWRAGQNPNHNFMVTGSSGLGKTQLVKSIICQIRSQGRPVLILDFKNDFAGDPDFLKMSNCEVQYVGYDGLPYNPLIPNKLRDPRTGGDIFPIAQHISGVVSSFQRAYGLGDQQAAAVKDAIRSALSDAGMPTTGAATSISENYPDFRLIGEKLRHTNERAYNRLDPIFDLELFREAYRTQPFNSLLGRGLVLDLSAVQSESIQNTIAQLVVFSAHRFLNSMPHSGSIKQMLVFDEAHRVLRSEDIEKLVRECRAYGLSVLLSSQYPTDFPAETASNLACKVIYGNGRDQERIRGIQTVLGLPAGASRDLDLPMFQAAVISQPGPARFGRTLGFPHWAVLNALKSAELPSDDPPQVRGVHHDRLGQVLLHLQEMGMVQLHGSSWRIAS